MFFLFFFSSLKASCAPLQDKMYCTRHKMPGVYELGLQLFRDHVVRNPQVNSRLKVVLLENIYNERMGEVIDRVLMKNALSMLVEVGLSGSDIYIDTFEGEFLKQTRNFYKQESQEFISHNTCPDYLRKVCLPSCGRASALCFCLSLLSLSPSSQR